MKKMLALLALMTATISMATVHTVNVNALTFSPANLTIQQGDTVRWIKPAGGFHNVEESNGNPPVFRSGEPTSSAFTYNFAFAAPLEGLFNYECAVHAGLGMVGTVTVEAGGSAPSAPSNPQPADAAQQVPLNGTVLSWNPAEGAEHYEVYFGMEQTPPLVDDNVQTTSYIPGTLERHSNYFWRVVAVNEFGETSGQLWSFRTFERPDAATNPSPAHNAFNVPVSTSLSWSAAAGADNGYQVYMGTSDPLPLIGFSTGVPIDPTPDPLPNTTYLWRVESMNAFGSTLSETWSFTTDAGSAVGDPAIAAAFKLGQAYPNPFNSNVRVSLSVAKESQTTVTVFDLLGKEVATLVNSRLSAGEHQLEWNATGQSAGLYFLKCECAGLTQTQKLIYLP